MTTLSSSSGLLTNILLFLFLFLLFIILLPLILIGAVVSILFGKSHLIFDLPKRVSNPFARRNGQETPHVMPQNFHSGETIDVEATVVSSELHDDKDGDGTK